MNEPGSGAKQQRKQRKFLQFGDRLYAITNWKGRTAKNDVAVISPLNTEQTLNYRSGKREGHSDTTLFNRIFPEPLKPENKENEGPYVRVHIKGLTKEQLVMVIEMKLGTRLASLQKMDQQDLVDMYQALIK